MTQNKERKIGGGISKDQRILQNLARNQVTSTLNGIKKKKGMLLVSGQLWFDVVLKVQHLKHHLLTLLALYFLLLVDTFKVHVYVLPLLPVHITHKIKKN